MRESRRPSVAEQIDMGPLAINTIRMLGIDAIQKAKSGHPDISVERNEGRDPNDLVTYAFRI